MSIDTSVFRKLVPDVFDVFTVHAACDKETVARWRERKEEEEEKEEEEGEKESETFERSAIPDKSDDRSHDRVQPITSTPRTMIVPMIELLDNVFETTDNSSNKDSKSVANVGRSRGVASLLGSARSVEAVLRGARDKQKSGINYEYGVYLHKD
ncbi:hypothetical protein G5I_13786 [Acromyrmex echinatior]|uniref:Uncharacterized protein n=1 Tax=Acromyrmex echinatior TaxID=103372 RepID=F4X5Z2_ACREC|nr:hypothetical protein G5I_13786 [Acromyrmex echinatior]